jgi:hypothetical protein
MGSSSSFDIIMQLIVTYGCPIINTTVLLILLHEFKKLTK